jgi:hypothetical protein
MTVPEIPTPTVSRPRTLQDDLLADLKGTVPPPIARPASGRGRTTPAKNPSRRAQGESPTVELQVTRTRWSTPSVRSAPGRSGVVLSAGPLRVSVSLLGR